jgi:hypothetical protein
MQIRGIHHRTIDSCGMDIHRDRDFGNPVDRLNGSHFKRALLSDQGGQYQKDHWMHNVLLVQKTGGNGPPPSPKYPAISNSRQ